MSTALLLADVARLVTEGAPNGEHRDATGYAARLTETIMESDARTHTRPLVTLEAFHETHVEIFESLYQAAGPPMETISI